MRKQLFNTYSPQQQRRGGGGLDKPASKLIWKPPVDQPSLLNPSIQKLLAQYHQNSQERLKEMNQKKC
jgi:hypothetical protein